LRNWAHNEERLPHSTEGYQGLKARLDDLAAKNRNRAERRSSEVQVSEIEKAALKPGEDLSLQEEKKILSTR